MARLRIEPRGRLVEDEEFRVVDERARQCEAPLHPAGERADAGLALGREAREFEEPGNPFIQRLALDAEIAPVDLEIFRDGEIGVEVVDLRNDADANPRRARRLRHRQPDHLDRAAVRVDEAEAAAQGRRLAGAVGAEQAEAFATADLEGKAPDDLVFAVALAEVRNAQDDFVATHTAASARDVCCVAPHCRPRSVARRRALRAFARPSVSRASLTRA